MHSAEWRPELDYQGKRVAVIGTGASAFQIVSSIAGDVERLVVFQRSASWMFANPHYQQVLVSDELAPRHLGETLWSQ